MVIPVSASEKIDENVWVIQASGNIGKDEKIKFDDFSVKVHEFLEDRVSLAIYKDNNFLELFDFYEEEWRQYENIRVEVHRIEDSSALITISLLENRTIWTELEPAHAFWGDYIQRDKYGIEICSFNNDSVNLIIYENANKLGEDKYFSGSEHEYLDDFNIYVSNIDSRGYVDFRFFKKLPLRINGNIKTQKDVYRPNEKIECQVEISNLGDIPINLVEMAFKTEPGLKNDQVRTINNLIQNQTHIFEIPLFPLYENEDSNVLIKATVTLIDYFGKKYTYDFSKNIYISSSIGITKEVTPLEIEFQDESGSIYNVARVKLKVFNVGTSSNYLSIIDSLPENIRLYNSSSLEWDREILPDDVLNITYYIIPDVPGEYTLLPAEVAFNGKTIYSGSASFSVHGPVIFIKKSTHLMEGTIIVTNYVKNIGDRAAHVMVIENLPAGSAILNGNDFWTDVMQPGETGDFNYTIQDHEDLDILPGASVEYQDIKGNKWYFESNPVELKLTKANNEVNKEDFILFLAFSYFAILGLVICVLVLIGSVIYIRGSKQD